MASKAGQRVSTKRLKKDVNLAIYTKMQAELDAFTIDFENEIAKKKSQFQRYLETRVNWLNKELSAQIPDSESKEMNNVEFLRLYDSQSLPEVIISAYFICNSPQNLELTKTCMPYLVQIKMQHCTLLNFANFMITLIEQDK